MGQEFNSDDFQGRSKEQVERTYTGMRIVAGFASLFIIILLTHSILKFILDEIL
jgi:hypothetical protein